MARRDLVLLLVVVLAARVPCTASGDQTTLPPMSKSFHLSVPPSHTALSGDLHVSVSSAGVGGWVSEEAAGATLVLRVSRALPDGAAVLWEAAARPDARALAANTTRALLRVPCGLFARGGEYVVELVRRRPPPPASSPGGNVTDLGDSEELEEDKVTRGLDVRWPMPRLSLTPEHVATYPESPVTAILEFPEVVCPPMAQSAPAAIPEFWLELHYCGHSLLTCDTQDNRTTTQVLYSEQIRGFPGRRMLTLRCELFGLAGHYALVLRPTTPMPSLTNTAAYVKADWSEQFVFNVHARSIMPCDVHGGGVPVLFQYPSCILAAGDRVRLYARLRADVASLAPPTSMEYVAERRVVRGQHALHFPCDLFTERYVEYCFVYVSQAITGAVADVRMDCVPTLPVTESESGGWGTWSAWTPCSSTCAGGTRNRYRFCDSPPPRYGAKFCEGAAVETERCGPSLPPPLAAEGTLGLGPGHSGGPLPDWECLYGGGGLGGVAPGDRPEVLAEVGPGCRCGCVVHLGQAKPRRLLATSSHSCPGRTFWLIQADPGHAVRFKVDHFRLPCGSQWLKVRDGSSLSAVLLAQLEGGSSSTSSRGNSPAPAAVQSTGSHLLLEFFSDELIAGGEACGGGFLAHAHQIRIAGPGLHTNTSSTSAAAVAAAAAAGGVGVAGGSGRLTAVHVAALLLASVVLVATALLAAQYVLRYRKYHVAGGDDTDSLADAGESNASLALRARASSSTTLLSEVISLTRLRPPGGARHRHTRLRESTDLEAPEHDAPVDGASDEDGGNRTQEAELARTEVVSNCSTLTLTPEDQHPPTMASTPVTAPSGTENSAAASPGGSESSTAPAPSVTSASASVPAAHRPRCRSAAASVVATPLTNGCYSPAASIISTATIRSTNPKESKEKRNRERLLAGPIGSEFSLAGPDADLELDYYDYNVVNAGAVPGSYLGMDPQYLVWIPPLDDTGEILQNLEKYPFEYEDIRPKQFIDPGSNQESPEEEMLIPKQRRRSISESNPKRSPIVMRIHPLKVDTSDGSHIDLKEAKELSPLLKKVDAAKLAIPLHEFPKRLGLNSPVKVHRPSEKETRVEKSPSVKSYDLDDIKFADDECDEEEIGSDEVNSQCNRKPYQDSNIITANSS